MNSVKKNTPDAGRGPMAINRREFLKISGLTGPGLLIGIYIPFKGSDQSEPVPPVDFEPNVFLKIGSDGSIIIKAKNPEIGQGVKTSFPQIIAEELEVDWKQITVEQGHLDMRFDGQFAGGSTGIKDNFLQLRQAGASAREMLIEAAARKWRVPINQCYAQEGWVFQKNNTERLSYAALAEEASRLPYRENPKLKDPKDFKLIGKAVPGVDNSGIVTGKIQFGLDARTKGMLVAVIARCPVRGGKVRSFDASSALAISGVKEVIDFDLPNVDPRESIHGVAVVAENTWAAIKGRDALKVVWDYLGGENESSDRIKSAFETNVNTAGAIPLRLDGNPEEVYTQSTKKLEAVYSVQFLSHVPMEPMNYIADVKADQCEVWGPTQVPGSVRRHAMTITGLPGDKITVRMTRVGGGFGRRLSADYAAEAILLSKRLGKPIQVVWTREDDIQNDLYRPAGMYKFKGSLDERGKLASWHLNATTTSRYLYANSRNSPHTTEVFPDGFPAGFVPNFKMEYTPLKTNIGTGAWRAPGHNATAFIDQSFTDEMAHLAGKDPVDFRLEILGAEDKIMPYRDHGGPEYSTARLKGAIRLAVEKSAWYAPKKDGIFKGFACHFMFGAYVAEVVTVSLRANQLKIEKVICAVDCGLVVNPGGARNQLEGGIVDGLQSALSGAIHIEGGGAKEKNFDGYRLLRMNEVPAIEVYFVESRENPEGLGEMSLPAVSAALCNAVFAATGKRIRSLPFDLASLV